MDKKRGRPRANRDASPPSAISSRTRSKSPARVEISGRDSAPIKNIRSKKTDSEEISSSSQSSTPKKLKPEKKGKPVNILDDSGESEEVASINARTTRLAALRRRTTPINDKNTPTPSESDAKRSVSRTASSLTKEDSDEDEEDVKLIPNEHTDFQNLGIYTKPLVNLLILIILAIVPIILLVVSRVGWKCSLIIEEFKNIENFVTLQAFLINTAIHMSTAFISLLPVGRIVRLPDAEKEHKFNGILVTFIISGFLFAFELKNFNAFTAIYNNIDRILFVNIFKSLLASLITFIHAKYRPSNEVNAYGKSGRFLTDYVAGREINPRIFNQLDLKKILYVQSAVYLLIINVSLLYKNVTIPAIETASEGSPINELIKQTYRNLILILNNSEYNAAGFVVSGLLILYALDLLIYEHHLATSFLINDEGCGAEVLLRFATFPFLISFLPRHLFAHNVAINGYILAFASIIFITGLIIKRSSDCLKYEYRLHPSDAKFKDLITMPTFQNRRLIVGKWWSRIRQPNLFGEILLHLALLNLLAPSFDCVSFIGIVLIIKYLIYRSIGVNRKNAIKYESSWQRYTSAVKYNLLPRVY